MHGMRGVLRLAWGFLVVAVCLSSAGCGTGAPVAPTARPASPPRLTAFKSAAELHAFLRGLEGPRRREMASGFLAKAAPAQDKMASEAQSVTNVQHAGIDEGDIVKAHGEHLIVLRRGRLFTLRIGADRLAPVSMIDAFAPDLDPRHAWYDEMLVSGDTIVVIGYSYERGGTELGLFSIDRRGNLAYRATYHLRSNDYYSSRNYASRLVGQTLIFYTPLTLAGYEGDALSMLPAMRKWHPGAKRSEFVPIYTPGRLYRPPTGAPVSTLHTVIRCDLAAPELTCTATGVMGPEGRVFYVGPSAVYVWLTEWRYPEKDGNPSWLYRLPLDDEPGALRVSGGPIDQFSFLEDDGYVNVLVRSNGAGDGMWRSEIARGDVALLRLPLDSFGDGSEAAVPWRYRSLPAVGGWSPQNRFVGGYVLYGEGSGWGRPKAPASPLIAYPYAAGGEPTTLALGHPIDRIEALGQDAVVVGGTERDLHFSSIRLRGHPVVAARYTRPDAAQGELRSHGFFYRAETREAGIIGLPVRAGGRPGHAHLVHGSAAVVFLRNDSLALRELGELQARPPAGADDGCRASCVDWYGNARPLFLGGRIFGLLGYEIVEGQLAGDRLDERGRLSFGPVSVR